METASYEYYIQYLSIVKYVFLFIGLCAFLYYSVRKQLKPLPKIIVFLLFAGMVVLLGAFPMIEGGADRNGYFAEAESVAKYGVAFQTNDIGYYYVNRILTIFPLNWYFYLHSFMYVWCIYWFSKSSSMKQYGILFLCMLLNFQFVAYGVNTMRAGLAGSLVLLAITFRNKRLTELTILLIAVLVHKSFVLPAICYLIAKKYDYTRLFFALWLLAIPLSAAFGGFFQGILGTVLGADERASYLTTKATDTLYRVGFRIDFILYSCMPIVIGYYMIYRLKFKDTFYMNLYNMYILANTFWILVIRADYSDRFAYLSWFIYCPILIYPVIKQPDIVKNTNKWIACCVLYLTMFLTFVG